MRSSILLVATLLAAAPAWAEGEGEVPGVAQVAPRPPITFGFRVGGYGFRDPAGGAADWEECRMNGLGLYAQRGFWGPLFLEAGADLYFAADRNEEYMQKLDRFSGLLSLAAGVRTRPTARVIGYAQLGVGMEFTRVEVEGVNQRQMVLPDAFLGVGIAVRVTDRLQLGGNMRIHAMGYFEGDATMEATPQAAAQGQLFVGYDL
jgi:hypothetical protein